MFQIRRDLKNLHRRTLPKDKGNSWMVSISDIAMITGREVYDEAIFMHLRYIMEAFSYLSIQNSLATGCEVDTEFTFWYVQYRKSFDDTIRVRRFLHEQKAIDKETLFMARDVDQGRDVLLTLLKRRTIIAPELIILELSTWDKELVEALLEYHSVTINSEVIRFVADNIQYGKEIMQLLLEREGLDTQCKD